MEIQKPSTSYKNALIMINVFFLHCYILLHIINWLKAKRTRAYLCTFGLKGLRVSISDSISVRESSCRSKLVCLSKDFYTRENVN